MPRGRVHGFCGLRFGAGARVYGGRCRGEAPRPKAPRGERAEDALRRSSGFTLIELIAVMVVLAILAAVAVPRYIDMRLRAQTAQLEGVLSSVREGLHGWYLAENLAPSGETSWAAIVRPGAIIQDGVPPNPFNDEDSVYAFGSSPALVAIIDRIRPTTAPSFPRGYIYFGTQSGGEYRFSFYANTRVPTTRVEASTGRTLLANEL